MNAQKIWSKADLAESGLPYNRNDIPEGVDLHSGNIFSIWPEQKTKIISRLKNFKEKALAIKESILKKRPPGKEQPWVDDAPDYIENSKAIVDFSRGKLSLSRLSKILKPDGPIRYMRKGQRCKVHIADFMKWCEAHFLTEEFAAGITNEYIAETQAREEKVRKEKLALSPKSQ